MIIRKPNERTEGFTFLGDNVMGKLVKNIHTSNIA